MLKWGIVGLGNIAHSFVKDLLLVDGNTVTGLASRSLSKATSFRQAYNLKANVYDSYYDLLDDESVDIVYIATPHNLHCDLSIHSMVKGKHVLCEKPLGVYSSEVKKMIKASKDNNVFLMEALWTRFNPTIQHVNKLVSSGAIGEVNYLNADFSNLMVNSNIESRLFNLNLAGGSLLDVGIYPIFLSYLLFGIPIDIEASARFHMTGVDIQTSAILKYEDAMSIVLGSFESHSDMIAKIYGTEGKILINKRWHEAESFIIEKNGHKELIETPKLGRGYTYEIIECQKQILDKQIESDIWSHDDSLNLISILDQIRKKISLVYPFEKE